MKIKIIDLLNKIYNRKDMPGKIVFYNRNWLYNDKYQDYFDEEHNSLIDFLMDDITYETRKFLNTEVEIKEENKKIEKITMFGEEFKFGTMEEYLNYYKDEDNEVLICRVIDGMAIMFNKVIDEVNKLKENK